MGKIIDLSGSIRNGIWGYQVLPGLEKLIPEVRVETLATVENDDFFASEIRLSTISGTYLEASSHVLKSGRTIDEYSVSDYIRPVKLIRLPYLEAKAVIDGKMLEENAPAISPGDALIIDTGWWRFWNKPGYVLDSPNFSRSAMEWIVDKKIGILGLDLTCLESAWSEECVEEKGGLLGMLFSSGALMAAPLVNLGEISKHSGTLCCMPLKVEGTSGAPVRAVYMEND